MDSTKAKQKLKGIRSSLTRLANALNTFNENTSREELEVRLTKLEEISRDFNQFLIENECFAEPSEEFMEDVIRGEIEDKYFTIKARYMQLLRSITENSIQETRSTPLAQDDSVMIAIQTLTAHQTSLVKAIESLTTHTSNMSTSTMVQPNVANDVKLPRINLPVFMGSYEEWPTFFDLFNTMIHSNATLSGAQKLQYLKGSLRGDAASLLKNINIGDANYEEAWQSLIQRFNKEGCIIEAHLRNLLEQSSISRVTVVELRKFLTTTNDAINGLRALKLPVNDWDTILIHILLSKLDTDIKRLWHREIREEARPALKRFMQFLEDYLYELEMLRKQKQAVATFVPQPKRILTASVVSCCLCKGQHPLNRCPQFIAMNVEKRREWVLSKSVCFNCLGTGHQRVDCKSSRCRLCQLKHHSLIHMDSESSQQRAQPREMNVTTLITQMPFTPQDTLLPTALVLVRDITGQENYCRMILDSGSQTTLISEACIQRLRLQRTQARIHINGIGSAYTRGKVTLHIRSRFDEETVMTTALILNTLTGVMPTSEVPLKNDHSFLNLKLADPEFNRPGRIDIILGADLFFEVIKDGKIRNAANTLIAQNSIFGWIVGGRYSLSHSQAIHSLHTCIDINQQLRKFWELEEMKAIVLTAEERKCEEHFCATHQRVDSGKYKVKLPFKEDNLVLGDSRQVAIKRLMAVERRFTSNNELYQQYTTFMTEYESLGHMRRVPEDQMYEGKYYMPHHAVAKPESTTTKLRVVFDASCKTTSGIALNDKLMAGAIDQSDILTLLIRFRKHRIAFIADIAKMYRQILINDLDRPYQRIVWRQDPKEPIRDYELLTVTYGTTSAPFLATRTLSQLAKDEALNYPLAAEVLKSDFYVDDLISGAGTLEQARTIKNELIKMLESAGFDLRKWSSNSVELLEETPTDHQEQSKLLRFDKINSVSTLGLKWDTIKDCFVFNVQVENIDRPTKRQILSQIAKIYDPLGWLSPCVIRAKMIIQQLWLTGVDWDDPISENVLHHWKQFRDSLHQLEVLKIPRWLSCEGNLIELHGFADASERAYGAAIYICTYNNTEFLSSHLVAAKTKVSPIKQLSIPRLELCAAHLLVNLMKRVRESLKLSDIPCYGWTDSTVVLSWLADHPRRWNTFVGNRTAEILDVLPMNHWRHIISRNNPADHASRGLTAAELVNCALWWQGPRLQQPIGSCPVISGTLLMRS